MVPPRGPARIPVADRLNLSAPWCVLEGMTATMADDGSMIEHVLVSTGVVDRDREFTAFMAGHADDLLRTAWLLVGDRHRAEELTQQALVRAYTAWPRAREGDPLAYTRRILVNLRVDTWRRRRLEVVTDRVPERAVPDDTARVADRDQLVRALALLTTRQRRIVVLRHLVGLPESEVAEALGVSVGTVKSTASRGLATLRTALTPSGDSDE